MGAHTFWCGRALAIYRGEGEDLPPLNGKRIATWAGDEGTSNMIGLAAVTEYARRHRNKVARRRMERWLWDQENDGLWCAMGRCEQTTPTPHAGMHLLALMVLVDCNVPEAITLAAKVRNYLLLTSTPDLAYAGPGVRGDDGAYNGWAEEYAAWLRELEGQPHRGGRGGICQLHGERNGLIRDVDDLTPASFLGYLPALWLRDIIAAAPFLREQLRDDSAGLPTLRLPVTVHRWAGGHLAAMDDPGPNERQRYRAQGSQQAKAERDAEDVTSWVRCDYGKPGRHTFQSGIAWESEPPSPPKGAAAVRIGRAAD